MEIETPYKFTPRNYQIPFFNALDKYNRAVIVAHRRWGKDKTGLNLMIDKMTQRVGIYYYFLPTFRQAKRIIWDGIDKDGFKFLDHFPPEMIIRKNESDMKIDIVGGSLFQLVGTDNYNAIMGTNPIGCVFSEYSLQDPQVWDYIRPILRENNGWAIFLYTFRGKNHAWDLYQMAKNNPNWFCQLQTVDNTKLDTGPPVISPEDIEKDRKEGMEEDLIQQEYYCNPSGVMRGAYYFQQIQKAEKEKRITNVPYDESAMVDTWWDLGNGDNMCIWFTQDVGLQIRVIDYLQGEGEGMPFFAKALQDRKYVYRSHNMPWDVDAKEIGSGKTLRATSLALGIKPIISVKKISVESGIHAVRMVFNKCWFDAVKCKRGLDGLLDYQKQYDEQNKIFRAVPLHNWASHPADAFRTFAVGHTGESFNEEEAQIQYKSRKQGY